MQDSKVNPKDTSVVSFRNGTDFGFTPEMGCMYDGRAVNGNEGGPGINAGESMILPYHIGHRLATNLAKVVKLRRAPLTDELNNPVGKPLWSDEDLTAVAQSFITEMYSENKPTAMSETDRLMAKVEEYRKMVEQLLPKTEVPVETPSEVKAPEAPKAYADKQEVIAELTKRGIAHDKRQTKAALEKLIV